jgi:hypothetical protein
MKVDFIHSAAQMPPLADSRRGAPVPNGCGPFFHDDPRDRPASIFGGKVTLHSDAARPCYLFLPVIPPKSR